MTTSSDASANTRCRRWPSLGTQILFATCVGAIVGWLQPQWGEQAFFLRDIFLSLIKSTITPLVFSTLVVGIVGTGDLRSLGRLGIKTLLYFEVVTTLALCIGSVVASVLRPGAGVVLAKNGISLPAEFGHSQPQSLIDVVAHIFPASLVDAMARGDMLQVVAWATLFAISILGAGEKGAPFLRAMESLSQIMFRFVGYVMMFAPLGVGAAMAHTVAVHGPGVLWHLGSLITAFYLALVLFVVGVFGTVMFIARIPLRPFLLAVGEPAILALTTTSSESALPKAILAMKKFGVPPQVVSFVMPAGYSFNLDGAALYLGAASAFIVQATENTVGYHLDSGRQFALLLTLMITSKGGAGVPRSALVILLATLSGFLPDGMGAAGLALIFGIDTLLDMGRACVNLIGNCLACVVVARWEGVFDAAAARGFGRTGPLPE